MSHIKFSSPFIKGLTQSNTSVTAANAGAAQTLIGKAEPHERRTVVIIQNQNSSNSVYLLLDTANTVGLLVPPLGSVTFDNYNGLIKAYASGTSIVHLAYAIA
jgi:hypothetical protein